ncbi:MAG: tetratricopeptide repeat protein [Thermoanaerobaculales bacterium]|jgi:tetratricopeptide (TPR) repeat protein|nr:tetratricopeptide repeat protein [Thermoanaerobaculales bacterium]
MTSRRVIATIVVALAVAIAGGPATAGNPPAKQAREELEFGYKAAKRGYWQEALERFRLADELTPNQPRILNNIAVALEANGRFDEALEVYRSGLALDPNDPALVKNLSRLEEFYAAHLAVETTEDEAAAGGEADDAP